MSVDISKATPNRADGLWYRCRDFVDEQSGGEWDDKTIADDADKLMAFIYAEAKIVADRAVNERDELIAKVERLTAERAEMIQALKKVSAADFLDMSLSPERSAAAIARAILAKVQS